MENNELFKNGTRVTTAREWYKKHTTINKATIVGYEKNEGNYFLRFDGCDCQGQHIADDTWSCQVFSSTYFTVLEEETRKVQETQNKNASSLSTWFGGQDEDD